MIPNYIWNYINGWSNYSCMVTIDKIQETGIGNRGSKSIALFFFAGQALCKKERFAPGESIIVKELRVDGSWCWEYIPHFRCALIGF